MPTACVPSANRLGWIRSTSTARARHGRSLPTLRKSRQLVAHLHLPSHHQLPSRPRLPALPRRPNRSRKPSLAPLSLATLSLATASLAIARMTNPPVWRSPLLHASQANDRVHRTLVARIAA